ncbi:MAG: sensor domain-containing diguanylate cyclase [Anaerolineales bacterium]
MTSNRWISGRIVIGGSFIALVAVLWGIYQWHMPHWFLFVISAPFAFASAAFHNRRTYFIILVVYILSHIGIDLLIGNRSFMLDSDAVEWSIFVLAGEIIYQLSTQRRRTEEISQQRIRELETMNDTLTDISSELELNKLLQTIVEKSVKLLRVSLGELLLFNKKTQELEIVAQYPVQQTGIGFKMKLGEGVMGRVALTKRPLIINDYKSFTDALSEEFTSGVEATMDVPLLRGDDFNGVLGVARHAKNQEFTDDDLRLLTVFANQATVAIHNARLYEEVQVLAFTDSLTGINNRRRLFELAEKEFKRAQRYRRPLSFMLVDIDHFKDINDTYGHAAGDEALRWFAHEASSAIRQNIDVIGRFGGEEFAFLYPETELPSTLGAAERLLKHFVGKKACFDGREIQVNFSAGVACLPLKEDITLDQLIERADKALYCAKEKRNCIAYWDNHESKPYIIE